MSEVEELRAVNERFYKALEELDLEQMERLWLHEPWVRCIHPGWDVLVGWEQVRESLEQIFASTGWMRVTPTECNIHVFGDVGMVACAENITASRDSDVGVAVAQATNLFHRTPEGWRMFHHHASPAPVRVTQPFSGTIQ
jgi:ketosteroid isomerase-like protein